MLISSIYFIFYYLKVYLDTICNIEGMLLDNLRSYVHIIYFPQHISFLSYTHFFFYKHLVLAIPIKFLNYYAQFPYIFISYEIILI